MTVRTPLSKLKRWLFGKKSSVAKTYQYQPGDTVIEDYALYSGVPLPELLERIADRAGINADEWHGLAGEGFADKAAEFYEASSNYILWTLSANPRPQVVVDKLNRFNPAILKAIQAHPGKRLFEFGGGVGVFCEVAARLGKTVWYMELPGLVYDFATWRFQRLELPVTPVMAQPERIYLPGVYDIVYTDAVIEHLPPLLQEQATEAIAGAVDAKGLLIFMVDLSGPTPEAPMHHHVDIADLHARLATAGLQCDSGLNTFCSIWRRA